MSGRELPGDAFKFYTDQDWLSFVALSNTELVSAEIASLLPVSDIIPDDVRTYFQAASDANHERHNSLVRQCMEMTDICGRNNLVFLKGASWLLDKQRSGNRLMNDIDVLVPKELEQTMTEALIGQGYKILDFVVPSDHHHGPALGKAGHSAATELHTDISFWPKLLPNEVIFKEAVEGIEGLKIPSLEHRLIHNVIHGQKQNCDWWAGRINLKDMLDVKRFMSGQAAQTTDWDAVAQRAKAAGTFVILASAIQSAHTYLGADLSANFAKSAIANLHVKRCQFQKTLPFSDGLEAFMTRMARELRWKRQGGRIIISAYHSRIARMRAARNEPVN
ncbi:MAG: nucleotidyltransferase family protein [Pseudomonadota bacterium]